MSLDLKRLTPLQISSDQKSRNKFVTGLTKGQIRSKILARLKKQKEADRNKKSGLIKRKLFAARIFRRARRVMFYLSFDGEVDTQGMIMEALKLGKIIAVPVCTKKRIMRPCLLDDNSHLLRGPYGIKEPAVKRAVRLKDLDLVIVPAVALDKQGNRLGRGKGYYDYFLKRLPRKAVTIGLAFSFQILPSLPVTRGDVRLQRVIFA